MITLVYMTLIGLAMFYPTSKLKPITKEDMDDHEYDRVEIKDYICDTMESEVAESSDLWTGQNKVIRTNEED